MDDQLFEGSRLPEDAAHRLLARAVELDATRGPELTISQLRVAAREAGISTIAFEAAVKEWQSGVVVSIHPPASPGVPAWLVEHLAAVRKAVAGAPVRNIAALAAFWGVLVLLVSFDRAADVHWLVRKATDPVALALGATIAFQLRARPIAFLLAGLAISQGAEFVMDVALRVPSVHGFGSHLALMIAGVAGVLLGRRLIPRPPRSGAAASATSPLAPPLPDASHTPKEQLRALTLRLRDA